MTQRSAIPAVLVLLVFAETGRGDELTLGSAKDNTLYQDVDGSRSNGAGSHFFAGLNAGTFIRRGLIAFDVAGSIPAGSTIEAVTLRLYMSRTIAGPEDVSLHAALADWGESTSDASGMEGGGTVAAPGDATWLHTFYPSSFWAAAGGDYAALPSATTSVGAIAFYQWTGAQLVADVQGWLDAPATNFGWVMVGAEPPKGYATAKRFQTRENPNAAQRPMLTITYSPPSASGACCLGDGSCADLTAAECAAQAGSWQGAGTTCATAVCPPVSYCSGDGTAGTSCPCGNAGLPGHGCDISQGTGGVRLDVASFNPDGTGGGSAVLTGTGFPAAATPAVVGIRGTTRATPPIVFGDGLLCIAAPVVRLGGTSAAGGMSTHAVGHGAGAGVFHYQLWFRNQPIRFCDPAAAYNLSNGVTIRWP